MGNRYKNRCMLLWLLTCPSGEVKMSEKTCIFCKIVRKEAPSSILYEDAQVLAFMDIRPVSEGHVLIIPKQHYVDIFDIPEELLAQTHKVTKKISAAVKQATKADGISIVQQNGKAAGQDIFHFTFILFRVLKERRCRDLKNWK